MATTIQSGRASSPLLTADVASRAEVYGGRGLVFDGTTDYLDCGDNAVFDITGAITLSCWVNPSAINQHSLLLGRDDGTNRNYYLELYTDEKIYWTCNGLSDTQVVSSTTISANEWYHIAGTYDGSNLKLYINGLLEDSDASTGSIDNDDVSFTIGARESGIDRHFGGSMSDVKVYSSALTEAEVQSQYLKPESVPSPSTLVAWYPMSEANPESPQSIVYDHSEKKLGDSDWNGSVITYEADGYQFFSGISNNTLYKVQYTIATRTAGGLSFAGGSSAFGSLTLADSIGTHTYYFLSVNTAIQLRSTGFRGTITDYSAKPILMGNHATTNFFGNELHDSTFVRSDMLPDPITASATGFTGVNTNVNIGNDHNVYGKEISFVAGKTYQMSFTNTLNSGSMGSIFVGVTSGTAGSADSLLAYTLISSANNYSYTFTPTSTVTRRPSFRFVVNGAYNFTISNFSLKEVGISSSGFTTAQNEPVIPQIPLVKYNEKMLFDGVDNKVALGSTLTIASAGGQGSVSAVVNISAIESTFRMIFGGTHPNLFAYMGYYSNNFKWLIDGAWNTASTLIVAGKTYHIIGTWNNTSYKFYVNGVLDWSITDSAMLADFHTIGDSPNYEEHHGIIDEVSTWNVELTSTQVQELFNDGVSLDATTHSKSGNLLSYQRNDGVTTWQDRRGWSYLDFDGVNDTVTTSADSSFSDTTYIWWMKSSVTGSNAGVFGHGGQAFTSFHLNFSSNRPILYRGSNNYIYWVDTSAQDDSSWHCWMLVNATSASDCKLFVDGTEITVNQANGNGAMNSYSQSLTIGADATSGSSWAEADIKMFGVYSGLKDQAFATAKYNQGFTGNWVGDANITNYWQFDNSSTVKDLVGSNNGTVTGATLNTGNNGTVAGSPDSITIREGLTSGKDGLGFPLTNPSSNVLRLPTVNEYLLIKDSDAFSFGNGTGDLPFSISAWIKMKEATQFVIVSKGIYNSNFEYILWINDSNKLSLELYDESVSSTYEGAYYNSALNENEWIHVCATYDGRGGTSANAGIKLYINGDSKTTTTFGGGTYVSMENLGADLHIGQYTTYTGTGIMDELMIYNKELSLAEIKKNYKHQKGKHKND